jgi:hypothetical protein
MMKSFSQKILPDSSPIKGWIADTPPAFPGYDYLTGVRGALALQAFVWTFLITFVPATVKDSSNVDGPAYQVLLRKIVSVIFWNEGFIYSSMILLSARTVCLPFLKTFSAQTLASALFRRSINLFFPVAVALAIISIVFRQSATADIDTFIANTQNKSISAPYIIKNAVIYGNSLFMLFWTTTAYSAQAASRAFPSGTLWVLSTIYQQSYTIYVTVIIIPYTRPLWRVQAWVLFIVTAFWVQSWAWYSITGLLLADVVENLDFKARSARGIKIYRSIRLPSFILYLVLMAGGLAMQYLWTDWRPQYENYELEGHTGLYYTAGLNTEYVLGQPEARDDNYLIILGFFLILETSSVLQWIMSNPLFVFLGRRSYSKFTPSARQSLLPGRSRSSRRAYWIVSDWIDRLLPRAEHHHLQSRHRTVHVYGDGQRRVAAGSAPSRVSRVRSGDSGLW